MPRNKTQGTSIPGCCLDQQLPGIAGRVATFRHLQVMMRGIRIPRLGLHQIQMIMDPPPRVIDTYTPALSTCPIPATTWQVSTVAPWALCPVEAYPVCLHGWSDLSPE